MIKWLISTAWALSGKEPKYTVSRSTVSVWRLPYIKYLDIMLNSDGLEQYDAMTGGVAKYTILDRNNDAVLVAYNNRSEIREFLTQREPWNPWLF